MRLTVPQEIALVLCFGIPLVLSALIKGPDLVALWPYPVAISASAPSFFIAPDEIPDIPGDLS